MKKVKIGIGKIKLLKESTEKMPYYDFFTNVKSFIIGILKDPIGAEPSSLLKAHGLGKDTLVQRLIDKGVIVKNEKIDEPFNQETHKKESRYYVSYKVPRARFKEKIKALYNEIF